MGKFKYGKVGGKNDKLLSRAKRCLSDKAWRMNHLYTIVDEGGLKVPYERRPIQKKFAESRHGLDVVLKSRQHGMTSEACIDLLDDAFFTPDLQCGVIAHTKLDAQKIFSTKIAVSYNEWPEALRRLNPALAFDKGHIEFANGSSVQVAVSFRSDTCHRLVITELGKTCAKYPQRAEEIKTGSIPAVHPQLGGTILVESTAEGSYGDFYELCQRARVDTQESEKSGIPLGPMQYRFHFFPWWQDKKNAIDPLGISISSELNEYFDSLVPKGIELDVYQKAWYSMRKDGPNGLGKLMFREEPSTVDECFQSSVEGAVYGEELERARSEGRIGRVPYNESLPVYIACDIGYGDATVAWFIQFVKDEIHVIDYYEMVGRGAAYHVGQITNRGYVYARDHKWCFMPHDIKQHEKGSGTVLKDLWVDLGVKIHVAERPQAKPDGIAAVRALFPQLHFDSVKCDVGLKKLAYYRFDWDDDLAKYSDSPVHDGSSHAADGLQTLAMVYKYDAIGGKYLGNSSVLAKWHEHVSGDKVPEYDPYEFVE